MKYSCLFSTTRIFSRNCHWSKYSYFNGSSSSPLKGYTIGGIFNDVVQKTPDREYVVSQYENKRYTYAAMDSEVGIKNNIQTRLFSIYIFTLLSINKAYEVYINVLYID